MPYTAFELNGGACLEDVEGLCTHLTMEGTFSDSSQPRGVDVERWLTLSYYWVQGILAKNGYAIIQTVPAVVGILQELNALDVAVKVELSNPLTGIGEPNERFIELKRRRDELLEMLESSQMLTALGATEAEVGSASELLAASGISKSRKRLVESNTDLVIARFRRGQSRNTRAGDNHAAETDYYPVDT